MFSIQGFYKIKKINRFDLYKDKLKKYKFLPGSNKFVLALNDLFKK